MTGSDDQPTNAMWINNYDYSDVGQEDALITLPYDMSAATENARLTFDLSYSVYNLNTYWDALRIDVYTDCGNTFGGTVYYKEKNVLATVPPHTSPYAPSSASHWRKEVVDLSDFIGESIMVHFINITGYGNNLYIDNVNIDNLIPPEAAMIVSDTVICQGDTIQFSDNSQGENLTWQWKFGPGASPSNAFGPGPHFVKYQTAGDKLPNLIIYDGFYYDTSYQAIHVQPLPVVHFDYADTSGTVTFTNTSLYGVSFFWDFGDGNTSTGFNPVHTFQQSGTYPVVLTATNDCGSQQFSQQISVTSTGVEEQSGEAAVRILPNPNSGHFGIVLEGFSGKPAEVRILDSAGRQVWSAGAFPPCTLQADLGAQPKGVYEVQVYHGTKQRTMKVVIQ